MLAIFKRELEAYFTGPIGYIFCAIFILLSNIFFYFDKSDSSNSGERYFLPPGYMPRRRAI